MIELSVIIPVYNSAACISKTVKRTIAAVGSITSNYEIILIDDGSEDLSWEAIKALKSEHPAVTGIRFNKNYGQHNALLCGLNHATGHYIVTLDDDLEQQPEDISKLYAAIREKAADLVYGIPHKANKGVFRKLVTTIYKRASRIENKHAGEGSSFRILSKPLRDQVVKHSGSLFFLDEISLWYTDKIAYVKVDFNPSQKAASGYGMGSLFTLSLRVLSLSSTMPLKLVRMAGTYIFVASIVLAAWLIYRKMVHHILVGYTSIMVAILFSTGIITMTLGIIGEYLGNLISLSNNKPSYSIKEQI